MSVRLLTLSKNMLPSKLRCGTGHPTTPIHLDLTENLQDFIFGQILLSRSVLCSPSFSKFNFLLQFPL